MDEKYAIALHKIFGLNFNKYFLTLHKYFGSFEDTWKNNRFIKDLGLPNELWDKFIFEKKKIEPDRLISELKDKKIGVVLRNYPDFSDFLLQISNVPSMLYYCGDLGLLKKDSLAIVGSRKASDYGLKVAKSMSYEIAKQGLVIVSGLARGIDKAAHEGTLEANGKTIAVMGSGLDIIYPKENESLYKSICKRGLVVSEFPLGTPPRRENFPIRNRIISGLSLGVFVVEARGKSGSLITCDMALEQGKDVFALPGPVTSANSLGTLRLIQSGAKLVIHSKDILEELGYGYKENLFIQRREKVKHISEQEKKVLQLLYWEPVHIDKLINNTQKKVNNIYEILLKLEIKGLIKELPGKYYIRT